MQALADEGVEDIGLLYVVSEETDHSGMIKANELGAANVVVIVVAVTRIRSHVSTARAHLAGTKSRRSSKAHSRPLCDSNVTNNQRQAHDLFGNLQALFG